MTGHYKRHNEEMVFKLVVWQPDRGGFSRERIWTTLIDTLLNDTVYSTTQELSTAMYDEPCALEVPNS